MMPMIEARRDSGHQPTMSLMFPVQTAASKKPMMIRKMTSCVKS